MADFEAVYAEICCTELAMCVAMLAMKIIVPVDADVAGVRPDSEVY